MSTAPVDPAHRWRTRLDEVLAERSIEVVFQPIVDTARGIVAGYEALSRFPDRTVGGPDVWFTVAREHRLAPALEALALRTALAHRDRLPANTFLTVNVAPDLLLEEEVRAVWAEQGSLRGVVIELTEQVPIDSYRALEPAIDALRAAGAMIAMDDAGAGYAGLRHLLSLRPSIVKLDRALIQDIDRDEAKRALVQLLGAFASRIDAWLLAEGVERGEELDALALLGVPLVQGYALGRPHAGWASLDEDIVRRLAVTPQRKVANELGGIVERVQAAATREAAAALFAEDPALRTVVVADAVGTPFAVLDADSAQLGGVSQGTRVNVDTPAAQVLRRALTRPVSSRFEPVMITDDTGALLGIARIERLMDAVLVQLDEAE